MKYPLYDNDDLMFAEKDANYPVSDFADFISQLVEQDILENSTEKGIASLVNSTGTKVLSTKQRYVLDVIVSRYDDKECSLCGEKIPFSEVLNFDFNDGLCSYHKNQADKDND
jgi:hypothetical protein